MQRNISFSLTAVLVCCLLTVSLVSQWRLLAIALVSASTAQVQPEATLSGSIADAFGGKLADATIRLYSADQILQTRPDSEGRFRFIRVPPGTYQFEAARSGFKTKKLANFQVADKNEPLSVILDVANTDVCASDDWVSYVEVTGGMLLTGTMLDSQQPVSDAKIDLVGASGAVVVSGRSNDKGEIQFADLKPGHYVLKVSHPKYQEEVTEKFWVARRNTTKVVVRMLKRGMIRVCG